MFFDVDKAKKFAPIAILFFVTAVVGAVESLFGVGSKIWNGLQKQQYSGYVEVIGNIYIPEQQQFHDLLGSNIGGIVSLELTLSEDFFAANSATGDQINCNDVRAQENDPEMDSFSNKSFELGTANVIAFPLVYERSNCDYEWVTFETSRAVKVFEDNHSSALKVSGDFRVAFFSSVNLRRGFHLSDVGR